MKWPSTIASQMSEATSGRVASIDGAQSHRHRNLRRQRDEQRAPRVTRPLQPASVREGDGDEEAGNGQVAQQLLAEPRHLGFGGAEQREQDVGSRDERQSHAAGHPQADHRRGVHALNGPLGVTGAQVLSGDGRRRAHQARPTSR